MTDNQGPASETAHARETSTAGRTARSPASKRRILLLGLGLVVLLFGTLYSRFVLQSKADQGWEAYQAGHYDAAIELFNAALEVNPQDSKAYLGRSWTFNAKRQWRQALQDSTEALRLNPHSALAATAKAIALEGLGQVPDAMKALNQAIAEDPRCGKAYYERARIAFYHNLKEADPLADVEKAIELEPRFAAAYSLEGLLQFEKKDYGKTIELCDKALELNPREATAYLSRGYARIARKDFQGGEVDVQKALTLDPSLEKVVELQPPKGQGKPPPRGKD